MTSTHITTRPVFEELSPPYATIVADPPWSVLQPPNDFRTIRGHSPLPYTVMDLDQIHDLPVESLAADYAHLYLWTINKYVRDAYEVAESWGFSPRTLLTWCKKPMGMGPGREFASITEFIVMAKRGTGPRRPIDRIDRNWWEWKRGKHSVKPDAFMDIVEMVSPGPRVELFARKRRIGWDAWGNEVNEGGQERGLTDPQTENGQAAAVDVTTVANASRSPYTSPATICGKCGSTLVGCEVHMDGHAPVRTVCPVCDTGQIQEWDDLGWSPTMIDLVVNR